MGICSNCNQEVNSNDRFCSNCGWPFGNIDSKQCENGHAIYNTFKSCPFCIQAKKSADNETVSIKLDTVAVELDTEVLKISQTIPPVDEKLLGRDTVISDNTFIDRDTAITNPEIQSDLPPDDGDKTVLKTGTRPDLGNKTIVETVPEINISDKTTLEPPTRPDINNKTVLETVPEVEVSDKTILESNIPINDDDRTVLEAGLPDDDDRTVFEADIQSDYGDRTVLESNIRDDDDRTRLESFTEYQDKTVLEIDPDKTILDNAEGEPNDTPPFFAWVVFLDRTETPQQDFRLISEKNRLGKGLEADIRINDDFASKLHSMIYYKADEDSFYISDLGSTNHTWLNENEVITEKLEDGDRIRIGHQQILFKQVRRAS